VEAYICITCGTQFAPSAAAPQRCPICLDERQWVAYAGQQWTTPDALRSKHHARIEEVEPGLLGIGMDPSFAIGQRALLVDGLLWDCIALLDDEIEERVRAAGGIDTIAISHPHYYTTMVDWAERFDARVLLHEADRQWIMRPSERIELWSGDELSVSDSLRLINLGGHFAGGTVCLWANGAGGAGALLSGDIVQVLPDRDWASFMWSYPNLIPLPAREVARIRERVAALEFDRVIGAWWDRVMDGDARAKVLRSADRYITALQ
jgi:hypothetical protein